MDLVIYVDNLLDIISRYCMWELTRGSDQVPPGFQRRVPKPI